MKKVYSIVLFALVICINANASDLLDKLMRIPQISHIEKLESPDFAETYSFMFEQPVNHRDPNSPTFLQKVVIQHNNFSAPVVAQLEGYMLWGLSRSEPSRILNSNQIIIEHRFFNESVPADGNIPWESLTIYNAATDQHRIIETLKDKVYPGVKWLSTGISKGGQTTIFHRFFYVDDVDASIAYVAPLNLDYVDPRLQKHLDRLGYDKLSISKFFGGNGDGSAKYAIRDFQTYCFEHFDEFLPKFTALAEQKGYKYTYVGSEKRALQLVILEYPFSFWQTGVSLLSMPNKDVDTPDEFFDHLVSVSEPEFFSDAEIDRFRPFYYQALTEIGFYNYKVAPFKKYLVDDKKDIDFTFCLNEEAAKAAAAKPYNREKMRNIAKWLQNDARTMMFIYGGNDAWSGTQVDIKDNRKCYKFVCENMSHGVQIEDFDPLTRDFIKDKIAIWMER